MPPCSLFLFKPGLFFAGEATNTNGHTGTVHGTIATGRRAAREVIDGLTAVREYQSDNRAALESASRAEQLALAARDVPAARSELAVALNRRGLASHRLGDAASVRELGLRLVALSEQMEEGRRHARANGLRLLGVAHETSGHFAQADECFEQSLALLRETGERTCELPGLGNLAGAQVGLGDFAAAEANLRQAIAWAGPAKRALRPPTPNPRQNL
jgi:tetratricopeptide (TPR) repeat protein